jgi:hypothetical protein
MLYERNKRGERTLLIVYKCKRRRRKRKRRERETEGKNNGSIRQWPAVGIRTTKR